MKEVSALLPAKHDEIYFPKCIRDNLNSEKKYSSDLWLQVLGRYSFCTGVAAKTLFCYFHHVESILQQRYSK